MTGIKKVIVIGNNVRSIACSAKRSGYTVYSLDHFGDADTQKCSSRSQIIEKMDETYLKNSIGSFGEADAIILGPGFEHLKFNNALNNPENIMELAGNKSKIPKKLGSMGIPHPETELIGKADELEYPLMIKPISGSGGMKNIIVRNETELNLFREQKDPYDFIAQEFIKGTPCSASVISNGEDAVVVALNEQLIGIKGLTRLPFAYCGNVTPFETKLRDEIEDISRQIAIEFKLRGSNGVDFMLTEKGVYVIEVNPRFQGSIDTVELSTGMNIFDAHIRSFSGELPDLVGSRCFAVKNIIYSNIRLKINLDISQTLAKYMNKGKAADIPHPGTEVWPDEPMTSILGTGSTRRMAMDIVGKIVRSIKRKFKVL
ncbi:MAG: ATP-grasp domain-containing protein [Candidatus Methanoperedens sp.]|nr:ATP-grasp domain-containing protein [Candidatus Methanoperedens sp.]